MNEDETESVPGNVVLPGRCDFCQVGQAKFTINGGLWWICQRCMDREYQAYPGNGFGPVGEEE